MKKICSILLGILLICIALSGCSGMSYEITGNSFEMKIKVTADDEKYADSFVIETVKGQPITFTSELTKGKLHIDVVEVINTKADVDDPDNYEAVDTVASVDVGPGDVIEIPMDKKIDVMMQMTAIGRTEGTLIITTKNK